MKHIITYLFCWIAGCLGAIAMQEIHFEASASKTQVGVHEQFKISFRINAGASDFSPPSMDNFHILSGPNRSTRMEVVNGEVSRQTTYSFILKPRKTGEFNIQPAKITYKGRELHSNTLTIKVVQEKTSPQAGQKQPEATQGEGHSSIEEEIFLDATVSKGEVYRGEPLMAEFRLFTRVAVTNYSITEMPDFKGFWTQDMMKAKRIQMTDETANGKRYKAGTLKKVLLYPQKSGTQELGFVEMDVTVRLPERKQPKKRNRRGLFDDPFFDNFFKRYTHEDHVLRSRNPKIKVKPLPEAGRPADFNGAVGHFELATEVDRRHTTVDEPVTLQVILRGQGNLHLVGAPEVNFPSDFEAYDPKTDDNLRLTPQGHRGSRTFEYLLIPRHRGTFEIPPISFSYFNPQEERYVTTHTDSIKVTVEGTTASGGQRSLPDRKDVHVMEEDILFIKTGNTHFYKKDYAFFHTPGFYALLLAPFLLLVGLAYQKRRREALLADRDLYRRTHAGKVARQRLSTARKCLDKGAAPAFCEELDKAMWGYLGDKFNIPHAAWSRDRIGEALEVRQVGKELSDRIRQTLDATEQARFAPHQAHDARQELYDEVAACITELEKKLS